MVILPFINSFKGNMKDDITPLSAGHRYTERRQAYWEMGTDAAKISEGKQAEPVQSDDPEWDAAKSPGGNE